MASSSYWQTRLGRLSRRRFLWTTGATGFSAAFLAACGGDDDDGGSTSTGGSTTTSGSTSASGASASTGASTGSTAAGQSRPSGDTFYRRDYHTLAIDTANAVDGGVLPIREGGELVGTLDPYKEVHNTTRDAGRNVYEFLVRRNRGPGIVPGTAAYLEMIPKAATSYEIGVDGLSYTWKLRPGMKFHNIAPVNGREMDIEDVKSSFDRFLDGGVYSAPLKETLDHIEYPDNETMVWHMTSPNAPLLLRLDDVFVATHLMPKELNADPELAARTPIGTNYKVLTKNETSIGREYERHEEYWQGKPYIAKWVHPVIPEYANAQAQFIAKNVVEFEPSAQDVISFRGDVAGSVLLGNDPVNSSNAMRFGHDQKDTAPWADERIRWAIRRSVDWEALTAHVGNVGAFEAEGIEIIQSYSTHVSYDPAWWLDPREGQLGDASQNYLFNIEEAKKLVEAAGFAPGEIDIRIVSNADSSASPVYNETWYENNALMASEFNRSGIFKAHEDFLTYRPDFIDDAILQFKHFGLTVPFPIAGIDPDQPLHHAPQYGETAPYRDADLDRLADAQRVELNPEARYEIVKEWQRRAAVVFPQLPVWGRTNTWQFSWNWMHNVASFRETYFYEEGHLVWLDPDMPNRNG